MREIKIRAWDDVEQKFWTLKDGGESSGEGSVQYFGNEEGVLEIGRLEEIDTGLGVDTEFTRFPLSQCIGVKDIHDIEICAGDLVEYDIEFDGTFERYQASEIVFDKTYGIYCFKDDAPNILAYYENLEIVGNIYENSDILDSQR